MLSRTLLLLITMLLVIPATHAAKIGGVEIPDSLSADGSNLSLNGAGVRKKLFLKLYVGSLYLQNASSDAPAIITANEPMAIRLDITSGMITAEKMEKATREGFTKATGGDTSGIAAAIESFINVFRSGVAEGDNFVMVYQPGSGTSVSKNGSVSAVIKGVDFKQALFGIWLSNDPVQQKLKSAMLGNH